MKPAPAALSGAARPAGYAARSKLAATTLPTLARIAATRYTVEQCIEEAKGEVGFDQYEVRFWPSWHRHITLVMMAHAWLASLQATEAQKGGTSTKTVAR